MVRQTPCVEKELGLLYADAMNLSQLLPDEGLSKAAQITVTEALGVWTGCTVPDPQHGFAKRMWSWWVWAALALGRQKRWHEVALAASL